VCVPSNHNIKFNKLEKLISEFDDYSLKEIEMISDICAEQLEYLSQGKHISLYDIEYEERYAAYNAIRRYLEREDLIIDEIHMSSGCTDSMVGISFEEIEKIFMKNIDITKLIKVNTNEK
jgi:hypothetical protein